MLLYSTSFDLTLEVFLTGLAGHLGAKDNLEKRLQFRHDVRDEEGGCFLETHNSEVKEVRRQFAAFLIAPLI